jgi:hypothetical protein
LVAGVVIGVLVVLVGALALVGNATQEHYKGTKPLAWASTMCGAFNEYSAAADRMSKDTDARTASAKTIPQLREILSSGIGTLVTAADELTSKIDQLGQPAVKGGDAVQRDLIGALRANRATLDGMRAEASQLPVSSPDVFAKSAEEFSKRADTSANGVGKPVEDALTRFKVTAATRKAIDRDANCTKMEAQK